VGHAHAAADSYIETKQFAIFLDGNEAEIVGEYVDVVAGRNGNRDLELARQVRCTVNRFAVGGGMGRSRDKRGCAASDAR
jgi:hypothetical protein